MIYKEINISYNINVKINDSELHALHKHVNMHEHGHATFCAMKGSALFR